MQTPAVQVRFVGMLCSVSADALARACTRGLDALHGGVACWDVSLQPPLAPWSDSGYAVHAQARMDDGSVLSTRAHGAELERAVREAFEAIDLLLLQEHGLMRGGVSAGDPSRAPAYARQ